MAFDATFWRPGNRRLLIAVCAAQLLVIALPFQTHDMLPAIVVLVLISALALFGSSTTAILYLCFTAAIVPSWFYDDYLTLPFGFKFYEGLLALVAILAGLHWLMDGRLNWPNRTRLDRPVIALLLLLVFSIGLGLYYGQSTSQIARDVRYPFYYALFFVVTGFFDLRKFRLFFAVVVASAAIVGLEYFWELVQTVNLRIAGDFYRVARIEGLMFPIGALVVAAILLYDTRAHAKVMALIGLAPIALALILTVGRGMWIGTLVGLMCLGGLTILDQRAGGMRLRRLVLLVFVPLIAIGLGYVLHKNTGIGVGQTAAMRVGRALGYERDVTLAGRFVSYAAALREIRNRPLLGGGHGATVSYLVVHTAEKPSIMITGAVDNVYLTILMRMGLVGLAAFLWVFLLALWMAYRLFQRSEDADTRLFCAAFIAVYSGLLVYSLADPTMFGNRLIFFHATFLGILGRLYAGEVLKNPS